MLIGCARPTLGYEPGALEEVDDGVAAILESDRAQQRSSGSSPQKRSVAYRDPPPPPCCGTAAVVEGRTKATSQPGTQLLLAARHVLTPRRRWFDRGVRVDHDIIQLLDHPPRDPAIPPKR